MFYIIIIISAIVGLIELYEKEKELFKRQPLKSYIKANSLTIIKVMLISSAVLLSHVYDTRKDTKNAKEVAIRDSLNQVKYADSLKKYNEAHSYSLESYGLKYAKLLAEYKMSLDTSTDKIVTYIDSSKRTDLPFVSYDLEHNGITIIDSKDTVHTNMSVCNHSSTAAAINVNYTVYLLQRKNNKYYKTKTVFNEVKKLNILQNGCFSNSVTYYKSKYKVFIDSADLFFIVKGTYGSDNSNKELKIDMTYSYKYPYTSNRVAIYTGEDLFDKIKDAKYYYE